MKANTRAFGEIEIEDELLTFVDEAENEGDLEEVESDIINPICDCLINIGLHPFRIHDAIYLPEYEVCAIPFNIKEKIIQSINEKG